MASRSPEKAMCCVNGSHCNSTLQRVGWVEEGEVNDIVLDTGCSKTRRARTRAMAHDGKEKVVCYDSRLLSKEERNYCVTRRELLVVVVFTNKFRSYLLGKTI